jgi:hypothetical protein
MKQLSKQSEPESTEELLRLDGSKIIVDRGGLEKAFGSKNAVFVDGLIGQIVNISSQGSKPNEKGIAFVASIIASIEPRDEIEALLAAQMAAVHNASMTFARRLAHVDNIHQQDSAERAFNKLCRTFAAQLEALKRYRTGGTQKMTVEHVHVHPGAQAIVGEVHTGGRGDGKN